MPHSFLYLFCKKTTKYKDTLSDFQEINLVFPRTY